MSRDRSASCRHERRYYALQEVDLGTSADPAVVGKVRVHCFDCSALIGLFDDGPEIRTQAGHWLVRADKNRKAHVDGKRLL